MKKAKAGERARRSGFGDKLALWFRKNRLARAESGKKRGAFGPEYATDLARTLTRLEGEDCHENTVMAWERMVSLPNSRYVGHLERLMGATWGYLDDPATPWPPKLTREQVVDLVGLFPDDFAGLVARLRRRPAARRRRAKGG